MVGRIPKNKQMPIKDNTSRSRILKAAVELLFEQGYDKTTTRQIVQRAGVLNGSLYYFFTSKEEIFKAVILDAYAVALERAEDMMKNSTNVLVPLTFPIALELYTANQSPRVAELLYQAHQSWTVLDGFIEMTTDWLCDHVPNMQSIVGGRQFYLNILVSMGAVGNLIGEICNNDVKVDYRESMTVIMKILSSLFQYPIFNIEGSVDEICKAVEEEGISIADHFKLKKDEIQRDCPRDVHRAPQPLRGQGLSGRK
jgi:AcrR family transcriptional regulator